jgi:hypothetical protein
MAKGGKIAGIGIGVQLGNNTIGNGIQVNGAKGTDTINANVAGTPVKLDNNEIVDGDVVISDDLGEADKYRQMINSGMNPDEVSAIMKQRAVQLNPNPQGNGRAQGGIWPPTGDYNMNNMQYGSNSTPNTYMNPIGVNNIRQVGKSNIPRPNMLDYGFTNGENSLLSKQNTPSVEERARFNNANVQNAYPTINTPSARFNNNRQVSSIPNSQYRPNSNAPSREVMYNQLQNTRVNNNRSVNYPNPPDVNPGTLGFNMGEVPTINNQNDFYKVPQSKFDPTNIAAPQGRDGQGYSGDSGSINKSKFNGTGLAEGLGFAATTLGNINAANRLNKTNVAPYISTRPAMMNIDANRPLYNEQISDINNSTTNYKNQILNNTSSSATAMSRLGALQATRLGNVNKINSQRIADRNNINNQNIQTQNRFSAINTQGMNQRNEDNYADQIARTNTTNALTGSTVTGLNNIIANVRKGEYQDAQLYALAKSYKLNINGAITKEKLADALEARFNSQMGTLVNQGINQSNKSS